MAGTDIMVRICTSPSLCSIEKVEDSPYPYPVNVGILRQNGGEFKQYLRKQVYLLSLDSRCSYNP